MHMRSQKAEADEPPLLTSLSSLHSAQNCSPRNGDPHSSGNGAPHSSGSSLRDSLRVFFFFFFFPLDRSKSRKCEKTLTWSLALQRNWLKRETQQVHADRAYGFLSVSLWWFQLLEHRTLSSWIWGAVSQLICASVKPVLDEETEELPDTSLQSLNASSLGECPESRETPPRSWFTCNVVFRFQFLPWFSGGKLKRACQKKLAECPEIPKSTILLIMFFFFHFLLEPNFQISSLQTMNH